MIDWLPESQLPIDYAFTIALSLQLLLICYAVYWPNLAHQTKTISRNEITSFQCTNGAQAIRRNSGFCFDWTTTPSRMFCNFDNLKSHCVCNMCEFWAFFELYDNPTAWWHCRGDILQGGWLYWTTITNYMPPSSTKCSRHPKNNYLENNNISNTICISVTSCIITKSECHRKRGGKHPRMKHWPWNWAEFQRC